MMPKDTELSPFLRLLAPSELIACILNKLEQQNIRHSRTRPACKVRHRPFPFVLL